MKAMEGIFIFTTADIHKILDIFLFMHISHPKSKIRPNNQIMRYNPIISVENERMYPIYICFV